MRNKFKNVNVSYMLFIIILISVARCVGISDIQSKIVSMNEGKNLALKELEKMKKESEDFMNTCDLITDGPICISNGRRILLPAAKPKGIVGHWTFDDEAASDSSGNGNHATGGGVRPGQAFGGIGASGFFSGDYLTVPYNNTFDSQDFSITFWLFVVQDFYSEGKGIQYCPLLQRGVDDEENKKYERAPGLFFDRKTKKLRINISTTENTEGDYLESNCRVTSQRWLHIGIVKFDNKLKLYVNGILDAQVLLTSEITHNKSPLYIGNTPWSKENCNFPFLMDELRYYNIAITEDSIQAEASPILGGIEPNFLQLGCMNCSLKEASLSCVEGYRLCTSIELHTGGYQIARSMGWLDWNTHLWTSGALETPNDFNKLKGLALCCVQLK
jgi:hypothetical protein